MTTRGKSEKKTATAGNEPYSNSKITGKKAPTMWRQLALEGARWYQKKLDPSVPHRTNVEELLKGAVLQLTLRALKKNAPIQKQDAGDNEKQDHNDDFLWDHQVFMENLDQSSRSRFQGFMLSLLLALPSNDPIIKTKRHSKSNLDKKENQNQYPPITMLPRERSVSSVSSTSSPILSSIEDKVRRRPPTHLVQFYSYPQMRAGELVSYLDSYFKACCLSSSNSLVKYTKNEIQTRAKAIVRSFCATVSSCVASVRPILIQLLQAVTMEILCVEESALQLGKLQAMMKRVASEYEHKVSFASLAFLSSPQDSAEQVLLPLIASYLLYITKERSLLLEACALEQWLSLVLPQQLRNIFKKMEFQSIGHLLEVCHGFHYELQHIKIPPVSPTFKETTEADDDTNSSRSKQAITDLQREVLSINGQTLPPITSRKQLLDLLSSTLNHTQTQDFVLRADDDIATDENPGDNKNDQSLNNSQRRSSFHLSTIDSLTRRLLWAASRTGSAGDAFFIVRDLFGGDEVQVVQSSSNVRKNHYNNSSVELKSSLSSVTIRCHANFDVYPKNMVGQCEPLIQLHTTTTEVIYLQEIRSMNEHSDYVLQEKKTENQGYKMLAIRPALYERVEEWNTPS